MTISKPSEDAFAWMSGGYSAGDLELRKAIIREGMSTLTEMTVSFQSKSKDLDLTQFLGAEMQVHLKTENAAGSKKRDFGGVCVSVENLGMRAGMRQYVAEVRPWFYLLTRRVNCKVFQNKTTKQIIEEIFKEHGFKDYAFKLTESYAERQYCVQYRESDYAFICRLLEQDGVYFFFATKSQSETPDQLVFCDSKSAHVAVPDHDTVMFQARSNKDGGRRDTISEWAASLQVTSGKVTLDDFEFFRFRRANLVEEKGPKRGHSHSEFELYDYPGRFRGEGKQPDDQPIKDERHLAQKRAKVRMEAEAIRHKLWRGASGVRTMGVGHRFTLKEHPDEAANDEYLVISAVHYVQTDMDIADDPVDYDIEAKNMEIPEGIGRFAYASTIEATLLRDPYRAPLATPWPLITGLQTAQVVGPKGEEIHTDDYGRIKVKFHWDRFSSDDNTASCWVRVATPWAGQNYGFAAVPRVGQEVVIQFEEGDPGRPICVGMLYNEQNPKVYSKKETLNEIGIRSNSTKDAKRPGFNELMFDDTGNKEMMRVQAQKDHHFVTKNISRIGVGLPDIETLADHTFEGDAEGSLLQVIQNNMEHDVLDGDHRYFLRSGSQEKTINKDYKTIVETGDMSVNVNAGAIEIEAAKKIVLKVGGSTITLTQQGIAVEAPMVEVKAKGMLTAQGKMTTVKGDAMLTLKGSVTLIN
ncbi:MAG: type VI secretion system tip protein TssI/VgrG [Pseudomonadota bacterium]